MKRAFVVATAALLLGCSNSETSELSTGKSCLLYSEEFKTVCVKGAAINYFLPAPVGTKVAVARDPGGEKYREVQVRIEGGPYDGQTGAVTRDNLRPL